MSGKRAPARLPPAHFALRFALAYLALAALAVLAEAPLNRAMIPCVKLGLSLYEPAIEVRAVTAEQSQLKAELLVSRVPGAGLGRVNASVVSNGDRMLVGPLLTLSAILAWSFRSARRKALGVGLGVLFVLGLAGHDVASAMALGITGRLGLAQGSMSRFYSFFLDSGGRQLLALASAGAAIYVASADRERR